VSNYHSNREGVEREKWDLHDCEKWVEGGTYVWKEKEYVQDI